MRCDIFDEYGNYKYPSNVELPEPNTATSMPCGDAISRLAVLDGIDKYIYKAQSTGTQDNFYSFAELVVKELPSVNPQSKAEQFAEWVAREIFDENWEYNKDAFAEIACRKLAKLGIVRAKGDEWELVESHKSAYNKCPICANRNKNCQFGSLDCHFEEQTDV